MKKKSLKISRKNRLHDGEILAAEPWGLEEEEE